VSCRGQNTRSAVAIAAGMTILTFLLLLAAAYRYWPRSLCLSFAYPGARIERGKVVAPFPTEILIAKVGQYDDELSAYLWFDYLRSRKTLRQCRVYLISSQSANKSRYQIVVELKNDALGSIALLSDMEAKGYIDSFDLQFSSLGVLDGYADQTQVFLTTYLAPTCATLEALNFERLQPSVAHFIAFKSRTDARTRHSQKHAALGDEEANDFAADIIAVARFYDLPLDAFLGIGAIENNYLPVTGDREHAIWKKRPAKGDIILQRRRKKVLVSDYSIGVWQISRETLRKAHSLYLKDDRDYTQLPRHLRPPRVLLINSVDPHVMTTYAGLILRDLLSRFHGDVGQAVGAYNGGPHRPNRRYAASVHLIAGYAKRTVGCSAARSAALQHFN